MKRSRNGKTIHLDDCRYASKAVHWEWADGMTADEVAVRMLAYPWLKLCKACFPGPETKEMVEMSKMVEMSEPPEGHGLIWDTERNCPACVCGEVFPTFTFAMLTHMTADVKAVEE